MKNLLLCLFFILCAGNLYGVNSNLLNRNILQVGSANYSQRDVELFILCKSVVQGSKDELPSQKIWTKWLLEYKRSMLFYTVVNDESQFYGSFQPSSQLMEVRRNDFYKKLSSYKKIKRYMRQMKWDSEDITEVLVQLEVLKLYLTRKNLVDEKTFKFSKLEQYLNSKWYKEATFSKVYRFYEGSEKYIKLNEAI